MKQLSGMTTLNDTIMTERGRDMKRCILVDRIKLYGGKVEKRERTRIRLSRVFIRKKRKREE